MTRKTFNQGNGRLHYYAPGLGDGNIHAQQQQQQGLRGRKRTRAGMHNDQQPLHHEYENKITPPFRQSLDRVNLIDGNTIHNGRVVETPHELNNSPSNDLEKFDIIHSRQEDRRTSTDHIYTTYDPPPNLRIPTNDTPWQLSIVVLLGIIGILIGLFVHFSTADTEQQYAYLMRRRKKFKSPNYKKKTDEWSDDADDYYGGDAEDSNLACGGGGGGGGMMMTSGNIAKKRTIPPSPTKDPTERLYYNDGYRAQESRLRKSATGTQQQQLDGSFRSTVPTFQTPTRMNNSRPLISSSVGSNRTNFKTLYDKSPGVTTPRTPRGTPTSNNQMERRKIDSPPITNDLPGPPLHDGGVGSGLEGFEPYISQGSDEAMVNSMSSTSWAGSFEVENVDEQQQHQQQQQQQIQQQQVAAQYARVKPMGTFTPTDSFVAMPSSVDSDDDKLESLNTVMFRTPPFTTDTTTATKTVDGSMQMRHGSPNDTPSPHRSTYRASPHPTSCQVSSDMDFPTPRIENSTTKREIDLQILKATGQLEGFMLPFHDETESQISNISNKHSASNYLRDLDDMPLVPNLNPSPRESEGGESHPSMDAPRSVLLEELHLIRMESGVQGPRWISELESSQQYNDNEVSQRKESPVVSLMSDNSFTKTQGQNYLHPMFGNDDSSSSAWYEPANAQDLEQIRQASENEAKLREASSAIDPADDPRNTIQHIRKDLTESSDTSSSLSSKIAFSELKLLEVIGGGGFGQVWSAKWKGTPVAVKVLTGSAQAENVPRAVIEEFIAEINMVSGMRHPNICLFMGACLDPPNRAIVTELCDNGSLWDALRMPLGKPYMVSDGVTREAWPVELYGKQPPMRDGGDSALPMVPAGVWPWILVKRVASGTARGMCYLHSGNPPVLHRDLKSANILLDESYTAKLADFGLSRLKAVRSGMTGNCGTVQWMAPEVLCNEDYAEPADVFSYGIILWEMLTKECPYDGMTPIQCALSVLNENNRPVVPSWCPQSFRALIKNCVERNPKDRPTFNQILAALDSLP